MKSDENIRETMRRRKLKWSALSSLIAAVIFIVLWALSLPSDVKGAQLAFGREASVQMALANGKLILCDHFANREVIDLVDRSVPIEPAPANDVRRSFAGFSWRRITFTSGGPIWSLDLSLLTASVIMVLFAGLWLWGLEYTAPKPA